MSATPYLDDGDVLIVNKTLASAIGLNESIVLRQLHYWIELNRKAESERHFRDGCWWAFNSYPDWCNEDFPFWSVDTVRRAIVALEEMGLIEAGNYNTRKGDQTKWYTINYARYRAFLKHWRENNSPNVSNRIIYKEYQPVWQVAMTNIASCIGQIGNLHRPLPETNSKTNSKTTPKPPKGAGKAAAPKAYPDSYELRKWSDALVNQALAEFDETIHALLMAWGDSDLYPTARNMLKRDQLKYIETARGLIKVGCLPARFQSLAVYTRATLSWRNNPLVVTDMLGQYSNWLKAQQKRITLETYETPAVDAYPRTDDYLQVDGLGNWIGGSK